MRAHRPPAGQPGHSSPPQSMSDSKAFLTPSLHVDGVGEAVGLGVGRSVGLAVGVIVGDVVSFFVGETVGRA